MVGDKEGNGPAVTKEDDKALLWNEFLRMIQATRKNPNLTLDELKNTVYAEMGKKHTDVAAVEGATAPEPVVSASQEATNQVEDKRPTKRSRWNKKEPEETVLITPNNIDTAASVLFTAAKSMPPDIETLWYARDGGSQPAPPEPPLFSASPPKLGDPSGKDLIGNEAALRLLKLMVAKTSDGKSLGTSLLNLCEACWMMMALKEEEVAKSQKNLEDKLVSIL